VWQVLAGLAFFCEIGRKVIFASSRILPWVLAVVCENQSLRGLQWRLCFGDAFVYRKGSHAQIFRADTPILAVSMLMIGGAWFEC